MSARVNSQMTGTVWKVLVKPGDSVKEGQDVVILESMKMEIPLSSEADGVVLKVLVEEGTFVNEGDVVVELE